MGRRPRPVMPVGTAQPEQSPAPVPAPVSAPSPVPPLPAAEEPLAANVGSVGTRELLADAIARQKAGKPLANHHARVLRDAWLLEMSLHIWPSLALAAVDLGISQSTLRGFADEGCPIESHSPIPKAPVLAWLLKRAHQRGAAPHANRDTAEELDNRLRAAKVAKLEGSLIAEAEDLANQGVLTVMAEVRDALLRGLPPQLVEAARSAIDDAAAETAVIELIATALQPRDFPSQTPAIDTED